MKFLCVLEKDGKVSLPAFILNQLPKDKRYVIELEINDKAAEKFFSQPFGKSSVDEYTGRIGADVK